MSASTKKKGRPKGASKKVKSKAKVSKTKRVEKKVPLPEKPKKAAPKPRKTEDEKKVAPKTTVRAEPVKLGPPPMAMVAARHIDTMHERAARGFSFGELTSAGIPLNTAKREDLLIDVRRRSVVDRNVEALKGWVKHPASSTAKDADVDRVAVAAVAKKK
jgi:ribosomal protein L13E